MAGIVGRIYDLRIKTKDRMRMRSGEHERFHPARAPFDHAAYDFARTAVVAIYPSEESLPFTINLLDAFRQANFLIIIVSNQRLNDATVRELGDRYDHLIEKWPIGRDFGCYQAVIRCLERWGVYDSIKTLALVNDSMFYPRTMDQTLRDLLILEGTWLALFENYQFHHHAQSFFQIFREEVVRSQAFKEFWQTYRPFSSRTHSINSGEVGLSAKLRAAGFFPSVLYRSSAIISRLEEALETEGCERFSRMLMATLGRETVTKTLLSRLDQTPTGTNNARLVLMPDLARAVSEIAERHNPTHRLALLLNRLFEAPLKRDLAYRETFTIGEIVSAATGFSASERLSMENDLRRRGLFVSLNRFQRMLFRTGRI